MSQLFQRVAADIQNHRLLAPRQKILVAVSGGVDSMVLWHGLNSLAAAHRWEISVAHFNHQLRGRASAADEKLVRALAKKMGVAVHVGRADVKTFAAHAKLSIEMAARKLRHDFLARVAREQHLSTIALAHHADDQVELFFLRLLRGTGGTGLAGMQWSSPSPADKKLRLIRPLLGVSKMDLSAFAAEHRIRFREDASNFSCEHLRNRIRHELLPLLVKNYQPGLSKTVLRLMEIIGAESALVAAAAQRWLAKPKPAFKKLPVAVQRQVLNQQLNARGVAADFDLIEQLRRPGGKFVSVGTKLSVACGAGKLLWREELGGKFKAFELKLILASRSAVVFAGRKFSWSQRVVRAGAGEQFSKSPASPFCFREAFDVDKVGGEIKLRHWRAGDRFQPIGLKSAVKLQDLFVNAKFPAAARRQLVVAVAAADEIFWVEGLRIGEKFKLTPETKAKLVWNCSLLAV